MNDQAYRFVRRIVLALSNAHGGIFAPSYGDSYHTLLVKWSELVNL